MSEDRQVVLGRITRAHGIRGQLKLEPYNAASETLPLTRSVRLTLRDGSHRDVRIASITPDKRQYILTVTGVSTRDAAEALAGAELSVPRSDLAPLAEGEVYLIDLIGLPVVTEDGVELGHLADLMETGANNVLIVRRTGRKEDILLPDLPDVVLESDPAAGRIVVRVPPGLVDDWD